MIKLTVVEKLALNKFNVQEGMPHIKIEHEKCQKCFERFCLYVCPAELYSQQEGKIIVEWAGCLECGTCMQTCQLGAIKWTYPQGGFGIIYRYG